MEFAKRISGTVVALALEGALQVSGIHNEGLAWALLIFAVVWFVVFVLVPLLRNQEAEPTNQAPLINLDGSEDSSATDIYSTWDRPIVSGRKAKRLRLDRIFSFSAFGWPRKRGRKK